MKMEKKKIEAFTELEKQKDQRVKKKIFPVSIFILSLVFFVVITTIQMKIIGNYIDYAKVSPAAMTGVFGFWFLGSVSFTFFTGWQMRKNIQNRWKKSQMQQEK